MRYGDDNSREEHPPRPVKRKVVTPGDLLTVLNNRLDAYGHCESCRFAGPIRLLDEPTDEGRNWSHYVPLVCSDSVASGCKRIADRILEDAAVEYNLSEPA